MEVILEKKYVHWTILVGAGTNEVCYEFEQYGVQIGPRTTGGRQIPERQQLGMTRRTHDEIKDWAMKFHRSHQYNVMGTDFGGKNCQDFVCELCEYLGVDVSRLPWRDVRKGEAAIGGAVVIAAIALGGTLLAGLLNGGRRQQQQQQRQDVGNTNLSPQRQGSAPQLTLLHNARFQPGPIGFTANWVSCQVTSVLAAGQAEREGVEVGMTFDTIEGTPFSLPLLDNYIGGRCDYTLTFKKRVIGLPGTQSNEQAMYGYQSVERGQSNVADQSGCQVGDQEMRRDERQTQAALCWAPW